MGSFKGRRGCGVHRITVSNMIVMMNLVRVRVKVWGSGSGSG